jgi:hypothetical protein
MGRSCLIPFVAAGSLLFAVEMLVEWLVTSRRLHTPTPQPPQSAG